MDTLKNSEDLSRRLLQNLDNFSYVLKEEHRKMSQPKAHMDHTQHKFIKRSAELSVEILIAVAFYQV